MQTAKRTYALPASTLKRFESEIAPGKRSAKIAELIEAWMKERERDALQREIIEGCREMNELYVAVAKEWEGADDDLWRALES
jgi:hypothetical protein